jgi:hypothetical protein
MSKEAIEERHMRAREAAHDALSQPGETVNSAIYTAIETATRVKITRKTIETFRTAGDFELNVLNQIDAGLAAALGELGLEVES